MNTTPKMMEKGTPQNALGKVSRLRAINQIGVNVSSRIYSGRIRQIAQMAVDQRDEFHLKELKNSLRQALVSTPYYRLRSQTYISALSATSLEEFLERCPIITKSEVREYNDQFLPDCRLGYRVHTTSGTSGSPLRIGRYMSEIMFSAAVLFSEMEKQIGTWGFRNCLFLSGFFVGPEDDIGRIGYREPGTGNIYCSIYALGGKWVQSVLDLIRSEKIDIVYGYASAVNELAELLLSRNERISARMVITTSEVLHRNWRDRIALAFGRGPSDLYGSQEGAHFAFECACGRLHPHPARGLIEVLNEGVVTRHGSGQAIVSAIKRPGFPLFRYLLGDEITIEAGHRCSCGADTPALGDIGGRSEDMVKTRDGRSIGYLTFHATKNLAGLQESQLLQKGYEEFEFLYVPTVGANLADIETAVRVELERRIGSPITISFFVVDQVPREARGKVKAVKVLWPW